MSVETLVPQIRISLDGKWLAWRHPAETPGTWTVIALAGGDAMATVTDRAVEHWHAMIAAAPLMSAWTDEIRHCIGEQPIEACSECMGLALAIEAVRRAAAP